MPRGTPYGIQALSDLGLAKVCDTCVPGVVDEDVWLTGCRYGGRTRCTKTTYPLEVPMNYIAGVEVTEAFSDIGQLVIGMSAG